MSETEMLPKVGEELTKERALELFAPYLGKGRKYRDELGDEGEHLLYVAADASPSEAARLVGQSASSRSNYSARWKAWGWKARGIGYHGNAPSEGVEVAPPEPEEDDASRAAFYEREARRVRGERDRLREGYAVMADIIRGQVKVFRPITPRYKMPKTKTVDEELTMLHLADSHIGEWVLPEHTAGLEQYGREVFLERKERLQDAVRSIVDGHVRKTWPTKHLFVHFYGDLATHENKYRGQAFRIDTQLAEQIIWGAHEMADLLRFLCGMFETVTAYEMPGNHGETEGTTLNTDWLLYYTMNCALRDQPNLHTVLSDSAYLGYFIDESLGILDYSEGGDRWNSIICHGQQARRYVGTPYYGLNRLKDRLNSMFGLVWDTMRCGHHHEPGEGEGWELVPSWVAATDFSVGKLALASRPQQLMNGFHPRKGETWKFKIDLADRPHVQEPPPGTNVYTPHNRFADLGE